ncbi:MAG: cation:proton antiporter [Granulosicoccaceae bacterium]
MFETASLLVVASALFAWLNYHSIRLPTTIGIMVIALIFSLGMVLIGHFGPLDPAAIGAHWLQEIDFNTTLMEGMLSFLLFAGALHVNLQRLYKSRAIIALLATAGVLLSTAIIGFGSHYILGAMGIELPLIYCLLFGSLISPTDPVAVMSILKSAGAPKDLEVKIAGESLFNDGIAVVVFLALLGIATGDASADAASIGKLFALEAGGGIVLGLACGALVYWMLADVDNYQVEVLLTLALVMGTYSLALTLHVSGVLAMVVAGLLIGNQGRAKAMSETTREHLDTFWELVDEILNAVLFLLIGLEVMLVQFTGTIIWAGLAMAVLTLGSRFLSVWLATTALGVKTSIHPKLPTLLTWGGLRGGISVALALGLPQGPMRETVLALTYVVVVSSILTQGLSIGRLIETVFGKDAATKSSAH